MNSHTKERYMTPLIKSILITLVLFALFMIAIPYLPRDAYDVDDLYYENIY